MGVKTYKMIGEHAVVKHPMNKKMVYIDASDTALRSFCMSYLIRSQAPSDVPQAPRKKRPKLQAPTHPTAAVQGQIMSERASML